MEAGFVHSHNRIANVSRIVIDRFRLGDQIHADDLQFQVRGADARVRHSGDNARALLLPDLFVLVLADAVVLVGAVGADIIRAIHIAHHRLSDRNKILAHGAIEHIILNVGIYKRRGHHTPYVDQLGTHAPFRTRRTHDHIRIVQQHGGHASSQCAFPRQNFGVIKNTNILGTDSQGG